LDTQRGEFIGENLASREEGEEKEEKNKTETMTGQSSHPLFY